MHSVGGWHEFLEIVITSRLSGEGISVVEIVSFVAIRTPLPRDFLSLR